MSAKVCLSLINTIDHSALCEFQMNLFRDSGRERKREQKMIIRIINSEL
jgi:hypothetical protein